ncbi:YerC/YecD family TrpR-related protein [Bacillus kwashiorkori]|uniref:YerC/YecD family TrpR-related protein n=1 Tax=Bacillus kwashiorkori TaxID=1522318 RepID=UPI00078259EC|nr:YerC/YecD family TrpR-related protein [Bacillus kwashiorkori]
MQIDKLRGRELDQLFEAILSLKDVEECYRFFDDLCTINEIQSLSQRLEVARLLQTGITYQNIEKQTGASTATISRVRRCLTYGNDGYPMVLNRINKDEKKPETEEETVHE